MDQRSCFRDTGVVGVPRIVEKRSGGLATVLILGRIEKSSQWRRQLIRSHGTIRIGRPRVNLNTTEDAFGHGQCGSAIPSGDAWTPTGPDAFREVEQLGGQLIVLDLATIQVHDFEIISENILGQIRSIDRVEPFRSKTMSP